MSDTKIKAGLQEPNWIIIRSDDKALAAISEAGDIRLMAPSSVLTEIWQNGRDPVGTAFACLLLTIRNLNATIRGGRVAEEPEGVGIILPSKMN